MPVVKTLRSIVLVFLRPCLGWFVRTSDERKVLFEEINVKTGEVKDGELAGWWWN
jgi:hypothetical protein